MGTRTTAMACTAGEHFVAYRLAQMGCLPALTRGGSPSVDLLVANRDGTMAVGIQVKTSSSAWREYKRDKQKPNFWVWDVGAKGLGARGDRLFYAFVDLKDDLKPQSQPDVFIVPSVDVADQLKPDLKRFMFWIDEKDAQKYRERWDRLTKLLK